LANTIPPDTRVIAARPAEGWRWAAVLIPGALLYFLPFPGLTHEQSRLVGIFVATIIALVAQPVRMGVSVIVAMTLLALTRTLPPAKILSGFSNVTVWLVFTAFLFAKAVTATGFGTRVGYLFVERFARTPLSLGYSMAAADLVLAPFIPSDTARGGGVVFPIARSVASAFGSEPGPTAKRMGSFLMLVSFHTTYVASAMFLTGMAANPLIAEFASKIGHVELTWLRWFSGSVVPGLLTLTVVPWLLYRAVKPEILDTAPARELARAELARMGPLSRGERWLIGIMIGVMAGWVTSPWHGIPNTFVALAGLSAILVARVLTWDDLLAEHRAWDALIWFERNWRDQDPLGKAVRSHGRLALGTRTPRAGRVVLLYPLQFRQHDRARDGPLSRLSGRRPGCRGASDDGRAAPGLFLQPECGDDALRHGLRASLLRRRLRAPGRLVAAGILDFRGESGDLDGGGAGLVEADWDLVGERSAVSGQRSAISDPPHGRLS
jgi:hypothetical protein